MSEHDEAATSSRVDVELDHVTKRFGDVIAVDDLSLTINSGEFFSLLGPSGCGKTTTLRMLGGFEEPSEGRILLAGHDVTMVPSYRRDVNTVFQSYALFPHLDVYENVAYGLRRRKVPKAEIDERVTRVLELVDLPVHQKRRASELSGGQQQRVALARALVNEPKLLLLDEPMSALDAKLRRAMQVELKRIQIEVGITFLYVTHDQEEAMTMSDRLAVMHHGKIEGLGAPRDVYDRPSTEFVASFLGASNLIDATVAGRDGDLVALRASDGTTVRAPSSSLSHLGSLSHVKAGVRPEKISISSVSSSPATGMNSMRGQLRVSTFTGVGNQYLVEIADGSEVTVYAQNIGQHDAPRTGEDVILSWPPEHTFVVAPTDHPEWDDVEAGEELE